MNSKMGMMASALLTLTLVALHALPAMAAPPRQRTSKALKMKLHGRAMHDAHRQPRSIQLGPTIELIVVLNKPSVFIQVSRAALPYLGLMSDLKTTRRFDRLLRSMP